jgi:hypothetical protein
MVLKTLWVEGSDSKKSRLGARRLDRLFAGAAQVHGLLCTESERLSALGLEFKRLFSTLTALRTSSTLAWHLQTAPLFFRTSATWESAALNALDLLPFCQSCFNHTKRGIFSSVSAIRFERQFKAWP